MLKMIATYWDSLTGIIINNIDALDVVREHHIPVIYLANDYEYERNRDIDLSGFHKHFI